MNDLHVSAKHNNNSLISIGSLAISSSYSYSDAKIYDRLNKSWIFVVGPILVNQTRLLQVYNSNIVIGCWKPNMIINIRLSIENIWPSLKMRLEKMWNLRITKIEIILCDPPECVLEVHKKIAIDPLKSVLEYLRSSKFLNL